VYFYGKILKKCGKFASLKKYDIASQRRKKLADLSGYREISMDFNPVNVDWIRMQVCILGVFFDHETTFRYN